jgi:hypothetical protein
MGQPIKYFESYLASEGFVAFQTKPDREGLRLVLRNKMYYEFVPFNDENFSSDGELLPGAKAINLSQIEAGKDYAILITTCSGAWRYMLGDTIKFVNIDTCEIKITGRTRQYLSLCGEHLSIENMNQGIQKTAEILGISILEYTVKGFNENGTMGHQWYVACNENIASEKLIETLDEQLCILNDDYAVERKHVLKKMRMTILPESTFLRWMEKNGKLGGQSKFPRVLPDKLYQDWVAYLGTANMIEENAH